MSDETKNTTKPEALTGPSLATQRPDFWLSDVLDLLPDPDPVLAKLGDRGEEMLAAVAADGVAHSLIQTRKAPVLNREFRLKPGVKGEETSPASEALAQAFGEDLERLDVRNLIEQILDAPLWGFVPIELLWRAEGERLRLDRVQALPRIWFGFSPMGELRFHPFGGVPVPVEPNKVITARVGASFANPYGQRALSRCLWPVAFKKGGLKAWVRLAEDLNLPLLVGKYPSGTPEDQQTALLSALAQARTSGTAVVDEGVEVSVHEGTGRSSGAQIHEKLQDSMDKVLARVITGQTLTHDIGQNGSRAAAQTHYQVMGDIQEADMALVRGVFATIARVYRDLNDKAAEPPRFVWFEEEDPRKDWADRDQVLTQVGVRFKKSYFKAKYGFSDEDFDLGVPQTGNLNPAPAGAANPPSFSEPEGQPNPDLIAELSPGLRSTALWGIEEAYSEEAELLGLTQKGVGQARSFAELAQALLGLAQPGPAEPLAVAMALGSKQGRVETGGGNA